MAEDILVKKIDPEVLLYKRTTDTGPEFRMVLSGAFNDAQKRWKVWVSDPHRGMVQETNIANDMGKWTPVHLVTSDNVNKIIVKATKPLIERLAALEAKLLGTSGSTEAPKKGRGRPRKIEALSAE
tara:strand:- start:55 stop:432 length:378 start_codon:yes stop_codon:yes gene_type:complete